MTQQFQPEIMWEKSQNPYETINIEPSMKIMSINDIQEEYTDFPEEETALEDEEILNKRLDVIMTPAGAIPINEYTDAYKIFNFWNGHTNFSITYGVMYIIAKTPGVEIIEPITRNRFKIAISKMFKFAEVQKEIRVNLRNYFAEKKTPIVR